MTDGYSSSFGVVGALQFPLASPVASLLEVADPIRKALLECFGKAIIAETGQAWTVVSSQLNQAGTVVHPKPVAAALPIAPVPALLEEYKAGFPLLCLYRVESVLQSGTSNDLHMVSTFGLDYILPVLGTTAAGKLEAQLNAVNAVLGQIVLTDGHPAYDGYTLHALGFEGFGREYRSTYGETELMTDQAKYQPRLQVRFMVTEVCKQGSTVPGRVPFEGADVRYSHDGLLLFETQENT